MADKKYILGLFIFFFAIMSHAQENKKFIPPEMTPNTYTFALPELQVDSSFIANLNAVLFEKESCRVDRCSKWKHFHITFEIIDSLNYSICVSLENIPRRKAIGFFEKNKFFYWLGGDIPPNILLEKKSKKRFSYKDNIPAPYDPPFWTLIYYSQTGRIEFKAKDCY